MGGSKSAYMPALPTLLSSSPLDGESLESDLAWGPGNKERDRQAVRGGGRERGRKEGWRKKFNEEKEAKRKLRTTIFHQKKYHRAKLKLLF